MLLTAPFWLFYEMSESETYKELGELTKCKDRWDGDDKVRMEAPEIFRVLGFRVRVRDFRPPRHRRAFLVS